MENSGSDDRTDTRYPFEADATVELLKSGKTVPATVINLGASGAWLQFKDPPQLAVGDEVACEFKVRHGLAEALPYWGVGKVVRVEDFGAAIELGAGGYDPLEPSPGEAGERNRSD